MPEIFRLKEQVAEQSKVFQELDKPIKLAVNFLAQADIINLPSITMYKHMLVKTLEYKTYSMD